MVVDEIHYCITLLDYHFSLGCNFQQLIFPLDLSSPIILRGCPVLRMKLWVNLSTFDLPMSSQSTIPEIVLAWVSWSSRVPTINSLMAPFLATEANYSIPLQFVLILASLVACSPRVGENMDGIIISWLSSSNILQVNLSGLLHMASFLVPLAMMKVVWVALVLDSCPLNPIPWCLGLYWATIGIKIPWPSLPSLWPS